MRLWTFQSIKSVKELTNAGKLVAKWDRYSPTSNWTKAYRWMAKQMEDKGIPLEDNAPIWAWYACAGRNCAPTLKDARALLSDIEIEDGIQTIEFESPDHITLMTKYRAWGNMLDHIIDGVEFSELNENDIQDMYNFDIEDLQNNAAIQSTLPYLCLDWVIEIRELNLEPDNFDYNPNERV